MLACGADSVRLGRDPRLARDRWRIRLKHCLDVQRSRHVLNRRSRCGAGPSGPCPGGARSRREVGALIDSRMELVSELARAGEEGVVWSQGPGTRAYPHVRTITSPARTSAAMNSGTKSPTTGESSDEVASRGAASIPWHVATGPFAPRTSRSMSPTLTSPPSIVPSTTVPRPVMAKAA